MPHIAAPLEQLLTPSQTSEFLQIPESTLSIWRCTRRVDSPSYVKIGRLVRYPMASLREYVARNTVAV